VNVIEEDRLLWERYARLPTLDECEAASARGDKGFLANTTAEMAAFREDARVHRAAMANPEPLPVMPAPSSLAGGVRLRGHAARWGVLDNELLVPGFFGDPQAAVAAGVPLDFRHDPRCPLGRVVEAVQDGVGLYIVAELPAPVEQWQETVHTALRMGLVTGLSYWATIKHEPIRTARLLEVCVTMHPRNPASRIAVVEPL